MKKRPAIPYKERVSRLSHSRSGEIFRRDFLKERIRKKARKGSKDIKLVLGFNFLDFIYPNNYL